MGWATGSGWQGFTVVPGTLTVGDSVVVSSSTQAGSAAFQAGNFDFNVGAAYGSSTATAPVYGAGVMGNILGATLTATQNILAGVIGKYTITSTNASVLGKAGVIGEVGDASDSADAAVLAVLGGDTTTSTPGAAFGVMSMNSTAASKFNFGLDLYRAAVGSYPALSYGTAAIRLPNAEWLMGRNAADNANVNMFRVDTNNNIVIGTTIAAGTGTAASTVSGVISVNTTAVGNVGGGQDDLMTYSLPANTLSADGKAIRITAWYSTASNGNTKTITLAFGGTTLTGTISSTFNNQLGIIRAVIVRTGASAQEAATWDTLNTQFGTLRTTPAETMSGAITIKMTGQSGSSATDDVVQRGMIIEVLN